MITVLVKKDSATIIPRQFATLGDAEAFCVGRGDIESVTDADGNMLSFPVPAPEGVQQEPPPVEEPITPASANE